MRVPSPFSDRGRGEQAGVDYGEVPPVPIPNTVVKLTGAENTWMATSREDRLMPAQFRRCPVMTTGQRLFSCAESSGLYALLLPKRPKMQCRLFIAFCEHDCYNEENEKKGAVVVSDV